jgi:RNA polymerase sigma-70 factor, ECF subfamily
VLSETALLRLGESLERVEHEVEDRRAALRTCLERVTGRRREVLEMRYSANSRVADIARHFGMSPDGVSVMLHRIRAALFGCIQQQLASRDTQ